MSTYRVGTEGTYTLVEAQYFNIIDNEASRGAYFYVLRPLGQSSNITEPETFEAILVGYVKDPDYVVMDASWAPVPYNNNPHNPLDIHRH